MRANEARCISKLNEPKVSVDVTQVLAGVQTAATQGHYSYTYSYTGLHIASLSKALEVLGYVCTYKYIHRDMEYLLTVEWLYG